MDAYFENIVSDGENIYLTHRHPRASKDRRPCQIRGVKLSTPRGALQSGVRFRCRLTKWRIKARSRRVCTRSLLIRRANGNTSLLTRIEYVVKRWRVEYVLGPGYQIGSRGFA